MCLIDADANINNRYQGDIMTKVSIKYLLTLIAGFNAKWFNP